MKTKISLCFFLFTAYSFMTTAQVPQGFNYQAIARNLSGEVIQGQLVKVKVDIQTLPTGGIVFWNEEHTITTTQFGLVSFIVGSGPNISGTINDFSKIDWNAQTLYLKTSVQYPVGGSYSEMGTTQIWSVPYSLVAKDIEGPIEKLNIKATEASLDSALFEVKNKQGQTIFAVYNEGVRIYVDNGAKGAKGGFAVGGFDMAKGTKQTFLAISDDSVKIYIDSNPLTKKPKGGFAVGGYDMAKGTVQNYIDVNADSIRMYIDKNSKAKKGGFAVGSFDMSKGGTDHFLDVATDENGIINPSQNRILWYPLKNAFLTGRVRIGTPDSVGVNSFATGYESKSRGMYSQALGFKAIANGDYSTAIGKNAVANNINSFAFGESAQAANDESYAFGRGAIASGYRSFAFGSAGVDTLGNETDVAGALGDYSFAVGQGSKSLGKGSFSFGIADTAQGEFSVAIGYNTKASGNLATAIGFNTVAGAIFSMAMGNGTNASGNNATALGMGTKASGVNATAMGRDTYAKGDWSTTMGLSTNATGTISTAMGLLTNAKGWLSLATGYNSNATGSTSLAMGYMTSTRGDFATAMGFSTIAGPYCHVFGRYNDTLRFGGPSWYEEDPLFIIANGSSNSARANAFTVFKNGKTALGNIFFPTQILDVNGNARFRSIGSDSYTGAVNITSDGTLTTATSDIRAKENIETLSNSLNSVMNLRGVTFTWIKEPQMGKRIGFIAQEVEKVIPELVFANPVDGYKGVNYPEMTAVLVEAMKEQQKQIESYKSQLQTLQEKVNKIEELLTNTLDE